MDFEFNGLNDNFRSSAYNSVRWACLISLAPKRKYELPFSMDIGNSCTSVFPNTLAGEQQE